MAASMVPRASQMGRRDPVGVGAHLDNLDASHENIELKFVKGRTYQDG